MKLIPHHQDDKHGTREYRSPDGPWRVVQTRRPGGSRNARPRWEVHERCEGCGPAGVITPPSSARGTRWSSWTPRRQRRGARPSRQRPPGGARPPNPRRNHPSPALAGRRRGRSRTSSTKPAPRTRGRCAACSTRCKCRISAHWDILITSASSWLSRRDDLSRPVDHRQGIAVSECSGGSLFKWPRGPFSCCRYQPSRAPPCRPSRPRAPCTRHPTKIPCLPCNSRTRRHLPSLPG